MKNNLVNQDIKTDKLDFSIRNNSEAWLTIPADGGQITFTGNADDAAKEFFNALIRERDGYISALKAERDALAANCGLYRESISKARRLINIDEMGDADDVLAKAERDLPATSAALAAIEARGVEKFADMCREKSKLATTADSCAGWSNCSVHASSFAIRLREAK
ncbi:hypothetical protein I5N01_05470 [Serratia marcescens]|nr:hypothetical protein [Serratia marcescens]